MLAPRDSRYEKKMDWFSKCNLPKEQMEAIGTYLKEDGVSPETLEGFPKVNLIGIGDKKEMNDLFTKEIKRGPLEAGKLFNVLYSVGTFSCYEYIPNLALVTARPDNVDTASLLVVYAESLGREDWKLNGYSLNNLIKRADGNPDNLKAAFLKSDADVCNGKIMLLASYFLMKYPKGNKSFPQAEEKKGLLEGLSKLMGKKEALPFPEEDKKLMESYERYIWHNLPAMLSCQTNPGLVDRLQAALKEKNVDETLLDSARLCFVKESFMEKLLGMCAYVNFTLSETFVDFLRILAAINSARILEIMEKGTSALQYGRNCIGVVGEDFDKEFGFDPAFYISWSAQKGKLGILSHQFHANQDAYLKVMEKADFSKANTMLEIIKDENPELYKEIIDSRISSDSNPEKEKLIDKIVPEGSTSVHLLLRDYLRGKEPVDSIYPHGVVMGSKWGVGNLAFEAKTYRKKYGDDDFYVRLMVYMFVRGNDYFLTTCIKDGASVSLAYVDDLFAGLENLGMDWGKQIQFAATVYDCFYLLKDREAFLGCAMSVFKKYVEKDKEKLLKAFLEAGATGRFMGLSLLSGKPEDNKADILAYVQDSSKLVKETLLEILYKQPDWVPEIVGLLSSKKAAEREIAINCISHWDNGVENYSDALKTAMEKEKNAKVLALFEKVLQIENAGQGAEAAKAVLSREEVVKNLHKGGKKRGLAWAYENRPPFSEVHMASGELASEEYLQAILLCYAGMNPCGVSDTAKELASDVKINEFALYVNELFDRWMEDGAEAKKRWVLFAASIHGGADIVEKLKHQISEWPQNARGAIAADAVQALALNPEPQALLIVDGISRKFKFKQVKEAAGRALDYAAKQLGLTTEQLADKIVPDLGFDENMKREFDYGERKFTVTITTALEIEIFDESGKKVKSMPAPGKKDDEEKAAAAYEEFKQLKKQMKTTVTSQKMRLELALSANRLWESDAWKELFVKNPVMHQFAIGLIWGLYENGKMVQSFRYMEDGSFNTEDEDEYEFPASGKIGLVHPIELTQESIEAWKQQLEDYEIIQPIEQLSREIFYITEEEKESKRMERFGGYIMNSLSLGSKLQALGWYRGSVQDAGGFDTYYREEESLGLGAEFHFSGSFVGADYDDEATVYDVRFYKAGTIERGSYVYDEADDKKALKLGEIPSRYFSEIVLQMKKVTASSQERDEDWKKDAR